MTDATELTVVARERADKRIDAAVGELIAAAHEIGKKHGIPEGIQGHSIGELLGRMAYIPSMARDLRRACGQELSKLEIDKVFEEKAGGADPAAQVETPAPKTASEVIPPSKIPDSVPIGMDVGDLSGVTVQAVKALKSAGLHKVGDVVNVPDEHLEKINGLGAKSVAMIRTAIAQAPPPKD